MKRLPILLLIILLLGSCYIEEPYDEYYYENYYSSYYPVYMDRETADFKIRTSAPMEVDSAGKFYIYKNYILLVEQGKGLHVFDNTDITSPQKIAFINLLNATDVAVKNDVLFANQSTDLVAIDFSDLNNVKITSRIENVSAPLETPPDRLPLKEEYTRIKPEGTILAGWELINNQ